MRITFIGMLVACSALIAQDENAITKPEVPQNIRQEIIDDHFDEHSIFSILWERYRLESVIVGSMLLLSILGIRNYAKNLIKQEQRLFDTFQSNAIMIFGRTSQLRLMNRAAKQMLGFDDFVSMDEDFMFYLRNAPTSEIPAVFEELRRTNHAVERELAFNAAKTMKTIVVKGYPIFTESRRLDGYLLVIADITEAIVISTSIENLCLWTL